MTDISTFKDVATAIRQRLLASTDIAAIVAQDDWQGIHRGQPETEAQYPLIRMQMQADSDDVTTLGDTVFQLYYIAVIGVSQDSDEADELTRLVFAELNRQPLTIGSPNRHSTTVSIGSLWYQEGEGNTYTHSGRIYRVGVRENG